MNQIMTQPLGYYTSYIPGNGSYLEVLQKKYGCNLQGLNTRQKLFLIKRLGYQLYQEVVEEDVNLNDMNDVLAKVKFLSLSDRLGIIRCLADNTSL